MRYTDSFIVLTTALFFLAGSIAAAENLHRFEYAEAHMGAMFKLVFYAEEEKAANGAAEAAFARIADLTKTMSDYDPRSELSRLSATAGSGRQVPVSDDLWNVLAASQALSRRTDGAFDVTVGPVVKLWRRARRAKKMPDAQRLQAALESVGHEHLRLDTEKKTAQLVRPRMRLDLGGIAKGYAADEALQVLAQHGIERALVDGSGDLALGAPPPGEDGWRIGIAPLTPHAKGEPDASASGTTKSPGEPDASASGTSDRFLVLSNCGVATSGDAFQYVEIDGRRYSHIIDPKTGLGLTTRSSVTVIARDATQADSLASAVSVLGTKKGLTLIDGTQGSETMIAVQRDSKTEVVKSKRFPPPGGKHD